MSLSINQIRNALDRLYAHLQLSSGNDKFISKEDIQKKLAQLAGTERKAVEAFYQFLQEQEPNPQGRITWADLERAKPLLEEQILPNLPLNGEKISKKQNKAISSTGETGVTFAQSLTDFSAFLAAPPPGELALVLATLAKDIEPVGYHSGRFTSFEPVYIPAEIDTLTPDHFMAAARERYRDFNFIVERFVDADREFFFGLVESQAPEQQWPAAQLIRYMKGYLSPCTVVILEKTGSPWHPTFVAGLLNGEIVGIRMDAYWLH